MTEPIPDIIFELALDLPLPDGEARRLWLPTDLDGVLGLPQGATYRAIKYDPTVAEGQGYVIARGGLLKRLKALAPGRVPSACPTLTVLGESAVRRLLAAHCSALDPSPSPKPQEAATPVLDREEEVTEQPRVASIDCPLPDDDGDDFDLDRDGEEEARRCAEYLERWRQYEQAREVIQRAERELTDLARR